MLKKWTRFQKWTVFFLTLALLINFGIIAILVTSLKISEGRLQILGDTMEEMAGQHIITTVTVDEDIPLKQTITVTDEIVVDINMVVKTTIPFTAEIPVSEEMMVPFKIGVKDYIKLDTTIEIIDQITIAVDDSIPLNQKVKLPIFGKDRGPSMPIHAMIPLKQDLRVSFNEAMPIHAVVPIDLLIIDTLPVGLDMRIPVDLDIPLSIPITSSATISFRDAMPVDAMIPISLSIPVDIPLSETALAFYFKKMAGQLRGLTSMELDK